MHRGFKRHNVQNMSATCALLLTPYSPWWQNKISVLLKDSGVFVCVYIYIGWVLMVNPPQQWGFIHLIFDKDGLPAVCSLTSNTLLSSKSKSVQQHQKAFTRLQYHSLLTEWNASLISLLGSYILQIVMIKSAAVIPSSLPIKLKYCFANFFIPATWWQLNIQYCKPTMSYYHHINLMKDAETLCRAEENCQVLNSLGLSVQVTQSHLLHCWNRFRFVQL